MQYLVVTKLIADTFVFRALGFLGMSVWYFDSFPVLPKPNTLEAQLHIGSLFR